MIKRQPALAVFAGGRASRMGGLDKAALMLHGKPLIAYLAASFSDFSEKLYMSGTQPYAPEGFAAITDIYHDIGPLGALHAALLSAKADTVFVVACDMPLLNHAVFDLLWKNLLSGSQAILASTPKGLEPLCAIYRKSCLPAIEAMIAKKEYSIRRLGDYLPVQTLMMPDTQIFFNVNTPEEMHILRTHPELFK